MKIVVIGGTGRIGSKVVELRTVAPMSSGQTTMSQSGRR